MEGRTIVRPNAMTDITFSENGWASMEGRTIVRPNLADLNTTPEFVRASMEGRTIVRPNPPGHRRHHPSETCFNGGPDNCPAKLVSSQSQNYAPSCFNGGPDNCPAKPKPPPIPCTTP